MLRKKKSISKKKEETVQIKEVGIFDDFLILDKEEPPKKTTIFNYDDWIILGKPDEKQTESRFSDLFKKIEEEKTKKGEDKKEEKEKTPNKEDDKLGKNNTSLSLSFQTTFQSSTTDSQCLEGLTKNDSLIENIIVDNKNNNIKELTPNIEEVDLTLNINKVISLEDRRATVMIKNIPNKFNQDLLLSIIDQNFKGTYDLFILPTDVNKFKNFGYCFINFTCSYYIPYFYFMFNGKMWSSTNSKKVCELTYSKVQGKNNLLSHYPIKIIYYNEDALDVTPEQQYIIPNVYKLIFNKCFPKEKIEEKKFYFITKMPSKN
jgi:hypothetical protein